MDLFTCAKMAKGRGVIVPREYIIYDSKTSENLGRPGMIYLRGELIAGRRIAGFVVPLQWRLSDEPLHQLTVEKECEYYGVEIAYGDAPGGQDWSSETSRLVQAQANKLRVLTNRDNARSGSKKRVLLGNVPAQRPSYAYIYKRDATVDGRGRLVIKKAWWELDSTDGDGEIVDLSPAWSVRRIFIWLGDEGRTQYWAAKRLNELGSRPPYGKNWVPKMIGDIVHREAYSGKGIYNKYERVHNPDRPLGDLTLGVKKSVLRLKPKDDRVTFSVPPLASPDLWQRANDNLTIRGRGRGNQGRKIEALLRARIMCPSCGKPMAVHRKGDAHYYYCRAHYCNWIESPCQYRQFVSGRWDDDIWNEIIDLFRDESWVDQQLAVEEQSGQHLEQLIHKEESKISRIKAMIDRVEDGFDSGLYDTSKAIQSEIHRLRDEVSCKGWGPDDLVALQQRLREIRDRNLAEVTFGERPDLVACLGIYVYPSDDLKTRRITCRLGCQAQQQEREEVVSQKGCMVGRAGLEPATP